MNAIVKQESGSAGVGAVVPVDSASLMEVISRAARDPETDVNKLERLMAMYERITASKAKSAYDSALAEMQPKLPIVDRKGKITIRDKADKETVIQSTPYALLEDISEAVTPILGEHGFAISFRIGKDPDGKVMVTAILSHREGHREETSISLTHDSTGSKNAVQATGSSVSYGKRYTMCALLNITTRGEDDDGKDADTSGKITQEQVNELATLASEVKANLPKFLEYMKVPHLSEIPVTRFNEAKVALEVKRNKK